ncbi:MAG: AraC family transcriptional regulator [Planctomycetes bacterium]|nr:AraC family transcriptional regulator [Planctomycetota bacterium]
MSTRRGRPVGLADKFPLRGTRAEVVGLVGISNDLHSPDKTDKPRSQIGLGCGYADQSAFRRQFQQTTGVTPGEFRKTFRASAAT